MENLSILRKILKFDWLLIFMIFLLICIGCLSLYSAAGGDWNPWANQHLKRGILGILISIIISFIDIRLIYKIAWFTLLITFFLLILGFLVLEQGPYGGATSQPLR